jgi:hypothetical protein
MEDMENMEESKNNREAFIQNAFPSMLSMSSMVKIRITK